MVTATTLALAKAGDGDAFGELTDPYRRELQLHCYRILGSLQDAEDMLQETLLAAWRGLDSFEERSSVRAWLYKIATNRCLNALRDSGRRPQLAFPGPPADFPAPTRRIEPMWLEPFPDSLVDDMPDVAPGPEARYETREALGLAFVAGLQQLPPRQRAVLVLRDVLGFRSTEAADMLDSSEVSVNSALQRARAALSSQLPGGRERAPMPRSPRERAVVRRFVEAFESADIERLVELLADDAWLSMPPEPVEYQGRAAIAEFFTSRSWWGAAVVKLFATRANNQPAFGYYLADASSPVAQLQAIVVLTLEGDQIARITRFRDTTVPPFGLPPTLASQV